MNESFSQKEIDIKCGQKGKTCEDIRKIYKEMKKEMKN